MRRIALLSLLLLLSVLLLACAMMEDRTTEENIVTASSVIVAESSEAEAAPSQEVSSSEGLSEESESVKIQITVGDTSFIAEPEENSSAEAFLALLQEQPITVQMSDYAGMEKVGPLGTSLPRNDTQVSVDAGDVILYQGNQITIYYDTNSWRFTRLAVIEDATKESLLEVLGTGDVEVTFSLVP